MVAKQPTKPRKRPSQARSQATVEAILEATTHVLVEEGFGGASTNKIAKVAGVSIGSLYQYFPNKEALVGALIEQHVQGMIDLVQSALQESPDASVPSIVRSMITGILSAHRMNPKLHQVIVEQVPRLGSLNRIQELERQMSELIVQAMTARQDELRTKNVQLAAFMLVHAVQAVTHAAVLDGKIENEALIDELCDLILRYLLTTPPSS